MHYSPVTNYDKACLSLCGKKVDPDFEFGSEGSGTIEAVGPGGDQSLKGRKVAFCHGGWSQFVVRDINHLLLFDDSADLK